MINMLPKLIINIALMFSLMLVILSANKIGLLQLATHPFDRIRNSKLVLLAWFGFASVMTGITTDMTIATILIPMALIYAEERGIDKMSMILTVAFGISAGSDFTFLGGGDNIISRSLLESILKVDVTIGLWFKLFLLPTLMGIIATGFILYKTYDSGIARRLPKKDININPLFCLQSLLIIIAVTLVFLKGTEYYIICIAIALIFICLLGKEEFIKLPFKAIYIWSSAFILGNYINTWAKGNILIDLAREYSFLETLFITSVLAGLTNILTNTAITTIALPFTISTENLWLFTLAVKAIDLSFMTIFANSCLAIASSYGLPQKTLFKIGGKVVVSQVIVLTIYFYFLRQSTIFIL